MPPGPEQIAEAIDRLASGGLVAFPTETVYGLGASALDASAVARVFKAKGRPATNPLIVHVSGVDMARTLASDWPARAETLARAFWPGPLTLVVGRHERVPKIVAGGGGTVAVRCPDHPLTLALIEALGTPIVGPSANLSGRISPTTPEHVRMSFPDEASSDGNGVAVLDGGACRGGIESTVVSVASDGPAVVLRTGLISADRIAAVLEMPVEVAQSHPDAGAGERSNQGQAASPGLIGPHYQPRTPTRLADRPAIERASEGEAVLSLGPAATAARVIAMPTDAAGYAARLYAALHEADSLRVTRVLVECPGVGSTMRERALGGDRAAGEEAALWRAIMDRLHRACAD